MAAGSITVNSPTVAGGKKLQTFENTIGPDVVESEAVTVVDSSGVELKGQKTMASSVPVALASDQTLSLPTGAATGAKQDTIIAGLQALNSLAPSVYDYISLAYTGSDLTTVVFKSGGSGGSTVATLTLAYTSGVLQSVTRT